MTEEKKSLEDLKELKEKDAVADIETSEVKETVSSKDDLGRSYATGKRKDAVARVWIKKGAGVILVNGKDMGKVFCTTSFTNACKPTFFCCESRG